MALETEKRSSRRNVLTAALGAAAGVALSALGRPSPANAAANGNVQLGHGTADADNDSATETRVNGTANGIVAFSGVQAGSGTGVAGSATTGTGVRAASTDNTPTIDFTVASHKNGLLGTAGDLGDPSAGGLFANTDETGVYGFANVSNNSSGVFGQSFDGTGVVGYGATGVFGTGGWGVQGDVDVDGLGVYGNIGPHIAPPVAPAGVAARSELSTGIALRVIGRTAFSYSGRATVGAGHSSVKVTKAGVTSSSLILATPKTNRTGVHVQAVVSTTGSFTIYLNKAVSGSTYVAYFILN